MRESHGQRKHSTTALDEELKQTDENGEVQVSVVSIGGIRVASLSFSQDATVAAMRARVAEVRGVPNHWIRLMFGSSELRDLNQSLAAASVPDGAVVTCVVSAEVKVVTGSCDTTAKIWSTETGECLSTFSEHEDCFSSAMWR